MAKNQPLPDLATLSHAAKDVLIVSLHAWVDELLPSNSIRKDSHNSSVPPSADGRGKKTRSLRQPSSNQPGGQPGHVGATLNQTDQPTRTEIHPLPAQCDHCHHRLPDDEARVAARRQVIDIPETPYEVVEHQILGQICRCGRVHCWRRPNIDPPCRSKFDPGRGAAFLSSSCG